MLYPAVLPVRSVTRQMNSENRLPLVVVSDAPVFVPTVKPEKLVAPALALLRTNTTH